MAESFSDRLRGELERQGQDERRKRREIEAREEYVVTWYLAEVEDFLADEAEL